MFRSQIDHHHGDKIFVLTSVTKFNFIDVSACLLLYVCWVLSCLAVAMPFRVWLN